MKSTFLFLALLCLTTTAFCQISFSVQTVTIEDVPAAVQTAQSGNFPGLTVKQWEKQTASGSEQTGSRFIANFTEGSNQLVRARYSADGTGLTATTYYKANQLPELIQSSAAQNYPDYQLTSGEKVLLMNNQKSFFRIRLRKGAQKLVVYVNNNGEEFSKDSLPGIVREDEKLD